MSFRPILGQKPNMSTVITIPTGSQTIRVEIGGTTIIGGNHIHYHGEQPRPRLQQREQPRPRLKMKKKKTDTKSQVEALVDKLDEVKQDLPDQKYLELMSMLGEINTSLR